MPLAHLIHLTLSLRYWIFSAPSLTLDLRPSVPCSACQAASAPAMASSVGPLSLRFAPGGQNCEAQVLFPVPPAGPLGCASLLEMTALSGGSTFLPVMDLEF